MKHLQKAFETQNHFWRYISVFILGYFGASIIGALPLGIVIGYKKVQLGDAFVANPDNQFDFAVYGIDSNIGLILMLFPFVVSFFALIYFVKKFHRRTYKELINGTGKIRWSRFFYAVKLWGGIFLVLMLSGYLIDPDNFVFNFDVASFIPLVFIAILLIPLQTTFEELFFRGYFAQGTAVLSNNRWVVLILPSIGFAMLHMNNPEVETYGFWVAMPIYLTFGLIFGLISILDDGIELAMGAHAANNVFGAIFITSESSVFQTSALFTQLNINPKGELMVLVLTGLVFIVILWRKYNWDISIMNKKIVDKALVPDEVKL